MKLVLDASAAISAVLARPTAAAILETIGGSASVVIAPDLYVSEVANALWKYVVAGEIDGDEAAESLDAALALVDRFVPAADLAQEALREAAARRHPVHDLCYVVAGAPGRMFAGGAPAAATTAPASTPQRTAPSAAWTRRLCIRSSRGRRRGAGWCWDGSSRP